MHPKYSDLRIRWCGGSTTDYWEIAFPGAEFWVVASLQDLAQKGYSVVENSIEDWEGPILDMHGNPISQSIKARESQPKYEPPMFEEREI